MTFDKNPGKGSWDYDWYGAIERAGAFAGTATFGERDWYAEGAAWLVAHQKENGCWGVGKTHDMVHDTGLAILFLRHASMSYADRLKQAGP
jgi:hypothetical protein